MITSVEEFVRLRTSTRQEEYSLSAEDEAPESVWLDVIELHPEMREWVAQNRTVPLKILERLATDGDRRVRAVVADKRKLSESLFELLSRDADEVVRQRIALNKKAPKTVIERLSTDHTPMVRDAALKRLQRVT